MRMSDRNENKKIITDRQTEKPTSKEQALILRKPTQPWRSYR